MLLNNRKLFHQVFLSVIDLKKCHLMRSNPKNEKVLPCRGECHRHCTDVFKLYITYALFAKYKSVKDTFVYYVTMS